MPSPIVWLLAAGWLGGSPAHAQEAAVPAAVAASAPAAAPAPGVQTVTITASKRFEKQREVAGTVSMLQGGDLERNAATDQEDLFKFTPGVQFGKGETSYNNIVIRGIGTTTCTVCGGGLQGTTGFYLEDVPLTDPVGKLSVPDIMPFDLDRIEVLRGPQGALYGSASLGGAVRYLLAKPNPGSFEATVQAGTSTVTRGGMGFGLYGMVNVPLSATGVSAVRAVAYDRKDGGYLDNPGTGTKDANAVRQKGARVLFGLKPLGGLSATLTLMRETTEQEDGSSVVPDRDKLEHDTPTASPRTSTFDFTSLALGHELAGHTLTSTTGYWRKSRRQAWDLTPLYNSLGLPFPIPLAQGLTDGTAKAVSEELRIANNPGGALSYVAGVFARRDSSSGSSSAVVQGPAAAFFDNVGRSSGSATEKAAFFDGEYAFTGQWSAGLGARYYKTAFVNDATNNGVVSPTGRGSEDGTTPKASLKYRFDDSLWYALASKGYRFGGVNGPPNFKPYGSDSLWNYETGLRLQPSRDTQVDLTVFHVDWDKVQVTYLDTSADVPTVLNGNVAKARSDGVEASLRYRVNASWDIHAALAYIDARTTQAFADASGSIPAGTALPFTAKLQTALQATVRFLGPLASAGRFSATSTFVGRRHLDLYGSNAAGGYHTLDLGLSFALAPWTLSANLANAGNHRGELSNVASTPGANYYEYFIQKPRTLTVSLRYDH